VRSRSAAIADRWARLTQPRADGLPNARVIAIPLVFLLLVFLVLVGLGITGSSTGMVYSQIATGDDPALVAGEPRAIRSDEWFVQTSWVISQVEQSLPIRNESFPGGMDATVQNDLPSVDWSTAFRPHLLGFFVLPLDQAMAFKWWLPGFGLIAAVYLLVVTLLPRRMLSGAALAASFFFAPFFQWWYLSLSLYPALWSVLVMTATVWCLRSRHRIGKWAVSALAGYATVAMAMGIYVPFIVPATLVAGAFGVGAVLTADMGRPRLSQRLRDILPLPIAGVIGAGVMVLWILTRLPTIQGFLGTVYPGERLEAVGGASPLELAQLFSGFLAFSSGETNGAPFTANSSEGATFLLPGLFLVVAVVWLLVRRRRLGAPLDWLSILLLGAGLVMFAFLYLPGWNAIAHGILLDRTTYSRMRIGFGLLSLALTVIVAYRFRDLRHRDPGFRLPWWVPTLGAALAVASIAYVVWKAHQLVGLMTLLAEIPRRDLVLGAIFAATFVVIVWLFSSDRFAPAAGGLLVLTVALSSGVNPLYVGVLDLRDTAVVQRVQELDAQHPGAWVGINASLLPTMMLVESGVETFNGVQGSPSAEMWDEIDPSGEDENAWNRLATISWLPGTGDPDPRNPFPDQIQLTFDSCATFAQRNVTWVLSPIELDQGCLSLVDAIPAGPATYRVYEVVPAT
jgi:hypothetical protein